MTAHAAFVRQPRLIQPAEKAAQPVQQGHVMTTATVIRGGPRPAATGAPGLPPSAESRAEWTKIRSVRSTVWSLGILVVTSM